MFVYEKKLQYPVRITNPNPQLAAVIISQYGGPDGELGASLRYLSQRYSMPYPELKGLLTDIGTEELGHLEMVGTIVHQLTRTLTQEQIASAGFAPYFVDHTAGVYPQAASGTPWSAATMAVTGDPWHHHRYVLHLHRYRHLYKRSLHLIPDSHLFRYSVPIPVLPHGSLRFHLINMPLLRKQILPLS